MNNPALFLCLSTIRLATVAIHIGPCLAELRALIPRLLGAAFDLQRIQRLSGALAGTGIIGRFH